MRAKRIHTNIKPMFSSQLDGASGQGQSRGCGFVFFIFLVVAISGWFVWQARESAIEKTTAKRESAAVSLQFLNAAQQQDYTTAQNLLTPSGQYTMSTDALSKSFGLFSKEWGTWQASELTDQELRDVGGLTICNCDYTLAYDRGTVNVRLALVHGFRGWRINTMSVE
jgi:hypothetical protein